MKSSYNLHRLHSAHQLLDVTSLVPDLAQVPKKEQDKTWVTKYKGLVQFTLPAIQGLGCSL